MGVIEIHKCPRCEVLFDCYCRSDYRCWCLSYTLDEDTLNRISLNFSGCLCPECLKSYAVANEEPTCE